MTELARPVDFPRAPRGMPPASSSVVAGRATLPALALHALRHPGGVPTEPGGSTKPAVPTEPTDAASPTAARHLHWAIAEGSILHREAARACRRRALLLWPRLDRSRLAATRGDPWRIARLVAGRTPRSIDEIVAILTHTMQACPVVPARAHRPLPEGTPLVPRR